MNINEILDTPLSFEEQVSALWEICNLHLEKDEMLHRVPHYNIYDEEWDSIIWTELKDEWRMNTLRDIINIRSRLRYEYGADIGKLRLQGEIRKVLGINE